MHFKPHKLKSPLEEMPGLLLALTLSLLVSCSENDNLPPTVVISSPAANSTISDTYSVQVNAQDDSSVEKIQLYYRNVGDEKSETWIGDGLSSTALIQWNTGILPSGAEIELVAVALDGAGNAGRSNPVKVKVVNSKAPQMLRFLGYSLPKAAAKAVSTQQQMPVVVDRVLENIAPPSGTTGNAQKTSGAIQRQDVVLTSDNNYYLKWRWNAYSSDSGTVNGYSLLWSKNSLVGPYTSRIDIQPLAGTIESFDDNPLSATEATGTHYGAVVAQVNQIDTAKSNYAAVQFLPAQVLSSPANGATIANGRPTLTWQATEGSGGYTFEVFKQFPGPGVSPVWTSGNQEAMLETSVNYPAELGSLASGTYYWRVIAIAFKNKQASAFSYSPVQTFKVP